VIAANVLLGINQGLTWSTTIVMKIDLVGPARRGLAMGFNEAAGYLAVAVMGWATGALAAAYGLRPAPFLLGAGVAALGLGLSTTVVRETRDHARHEAAHHPPPAGGHHDRPTGGQIFTLTSFRERALSAASQAGLVNNLNDGLAWGLYPVLFATAGLGLTPTGLLIAIYPAVWSLGQLATGACTGAPVRTGSAGVMDTHPGLDPETVYLDYNATTPTDPRVLDAMLPYLATHFGNPSNGHRHGATPADALATARQQVAELIGAQPGEIVFTGSGSEADNLAIRGAALANPGRDGTPTAVHDRTCVSCRRTTRHSPRAHRPE
jgi:hypothetical protein